MTEKIADVPEDLSVSPVDGIIEDSVEMSPEDVSRTRTVSLEDILSSAKKKVEEEAKSPVIDKGIPDEPGDFPEDVKAAELRALDFDYRAKCKTCNLALRDPKIHNMLREENNVSRLMRYLENTYGDDAPSRKRLDVHLREHFWPVEGSSEFKVGTYRKDLDQTLSRINSASTVEEVSELKAVLNRNLTKLDMMNFGDDDRMYLESRKVLTNLVKAYVGVIDQQRKIQGQDNTKEEMNSRFEKYLEKWVDNIVAAASSPAEATNIINSLMNNKPSDDM